MHVDDNGTDNDVTPTVAQGEPTNAILLGELKKVTEAVGKLHKRLKNTEDTISGIQSELNLLTEKKKSKSVVASKEVKVSVCYV